MIESMSGTGFGDNDLIGATNFSDGRYETVSMMKTRMNTFIAKSGIKVASIETVSIDGACRAEDNSARAMMKTRMNSGRYRSGFDRSEWVYQTLRLWYNALDPANMTPVVLEEIGKANQLSDATAKTVVEGCVVM